MSDTIRIPVAEDHLARVGVSTIVNMQPDMAVVAASNGQQAVGMFRQHLPDVTLLICACP